MAQPLKARLKTKNKIKQTSKLEKKKLERKQPFLTVALPSPNEISVFCVTLDVASGTH